MIELDHMPCWLRYFRCFQWTEMYVQDYGFSYSAVHWLYEGYRHVELKKDGFILLGRVSCTEWHPILECQKGVRGGA